MGQPVEQSLQDRAVLLLINGMALAEVERFCMSRGLTAEDAKQTMAMARKRITITAEYTKDEYLGKAVMRLEDLYAKSVQVKDIKTALQAQRELNRLLDLYGSGDAPGDEAEGGGSEDARRLALIEQYLLPLGLTDERYPIEEHARIAAEKLRQRVQPQEGSGA